MSHGVEGNRLYLICQSHPDAEHSLMLGMRRNGGYARAPSQREIQACFDEHEKCPGGLDHFKSALQKPANWDAPEIVTPDSNIHAAVKLALVKE